MRRLVPLFLLLSLAPAPADAAEQRTPNLSIELRLPYAGGTELATDGRYVYAGQWNGKFERGSLPKQGGVRIFDTQGAKPRLVGTIRCPGTDMDVAVPKPGLLAVAYHRSSCGVRDNGITLFDVKNPAKPKKLGSVALPSAHTLTAIPGTNFLYVSPGGLGNAFGYSSVVDVTDPRKPRLRTYVRPDSLGCHDVTFAKNLSGRTLGVCTGWSGIRIWDMTDPLEPRTLSFTPAQDEVTGDEIQFAHGSAISPDGTLLVVNDEAFSEHRCDGGGSDDYGSLHLYDITEPSAPVFLGRIVPPRGKKASVGRGDWAQNWCTSHQLNFMPGSRKLVNAWFTGGISVWDLTVPAAPREEAYYVGNGAVTWTAHWFGDRIWVNDLARGVEVLSLDPMPPLPVATAASPAWRPASTVRLAGPLTPRPAPPRNAFVCKVPL